MCVCCRGGKYYNYGIVGGFPQEALLVSLDL